MPTADEIMAAFRGYGSLGTTKNEKDYQHKHNRYVHGRAQRDKSGTLGALATVPILAGYELTKKAAMSKNPYIAVPGQSFLRTAGRVLSRPFFSRMTPEMPREAPWEKDPYDNFWEIDKTTREPSMEVIASYIRGIMGQEEEPPGNALFKEYPGSHLYYQGDYKK